ncbi:TetR/AcrR family transcriptional regulator [Pseudonocardia sp. TRM90224]|uniref:TetR/AcrR family transcriptional regulator n=1 Tax=Pseudonocardia sp. TRM90224 TaxID=2812678 RepID=UPI001E5A8A1B|nr:TetR/AcrR family transcriptional regulator [Pseudonocardia sp. TRM90224]
MATPPPTDLRLLRGARSRHTVLRHAIDIASLDGLTALSLGRLATDLDISKSGIQTLFGTKENLQVATVAAAGEAFHDAVVVPALAAERGVARLRALVERWVDYASTPLFAGGCFWAANLAEFDSRPGPVRDALARQQRQWRSLLAAELRHATEKGEIADLDPELAAFQLDAVLLAANTSLRLGDETATAMVERTVQGLLTPPQ